MSKAILITEENKNQLVNQYIDSPWAPIIPESIGYYLVSDFGMPDFMLATKPTLDGLYNTTDNKLNNDYFEVVRK